MTFKELSQTIYDLATSQKTMSAEQLEKLDSEAKEIFNHTDQSIILSSIKKISLLNILHKDVNFKVFEKLPNIWGVFQLGGTLLYEQRG